jgi:glutamate-5-semialdehyde dehydrogenase
MSAGTEITTLTQLEAGQEIPFGGDRVTTVSAELAERVRARRPADRGAGHRRSAPHSRRRRTDVVGAAVDAALRVSRRSPTAPMADHPRSSLGSPHLLADDAAFAPIAAANIDDVDRARARGRSTTRLELSTNGCAPTWSPGSAGWRRLAEPPRRGRSTIEHEGWALAARRAPLGVVGFVFEGRPNVFADACGVVRTGNAVVFRIGSDALGTAGRSSSRRSRLPWPRRTADGCGPARRLAGARRGHALFSDRRLSLAVARGSGPLLLNSARSRPRAGIPVSLHGTGGAWIVGRRRACDPDALPPPSCTPSTARCATPSTSVRSRGAGRRAGPGVPGRDCAAPSGASRQASPRLHVVAGSEAFVPAEWFHTTVSIDRADGTSDEPMRHACRRVGPGGRVGVGGRAGGHARRGRRPRRTASSSATATAPLRRLARQRPTRAEHDGSTSGRRPVRRDGFTRWVDGQYALDKPELGLSNWQHGRMLGRGGDPLGRQRAPCATGRRSPTARSASLTGVVASASGSSCDQLLESCAAFVCTPW